MIKEMTQQQQSKIPVYLKKWLDHGHRTKKINKEKSEKAIYFLYEKILKIEKPKYIIYLDSPMACQLAANLIKNTKLESTQLDNQLDNQLYNQLYNQLHDQLVNKLHDQLDNQLRTQLHDQLDNQLDNQLHDQLYNQLDNQLDNQLHDQLANQLRTQLVNKLHDQLDNQLDNQLRTQLVNKLHDQLDNQLVNQLRNQQINSQKLDYFSYPITLWWWPGWIGFYDFILHELFPEKLNEFKLFREFLTHFHELHYYLAFNEIVFVSDFPEEINLNKEHQLHNDSGPSLLYRDGYSLYNLNGITVSKEIAETPKDKITREMITKETNADARREIIRKIGNERLLKILDYKVLDKFDEYELINFDIGDGRLRPHLKMICPSTGLLHILGTRPENDTCNKALAFLFTQEKWKRPIKEDGKINDLLTPDKFNDGDVLYRHGDVNFKKYSDEINVVKNPIEKGIIHAGNNNNHEFVSGLFEVQSVGNKKIVVVLDNSTIGHNEHGELIVPPGAYEITIAMEYSHWDEEARQVID